MTDSKFANSLLKLLKSYEHVSTKFNERASFEKAGLSINIENNPPIVKFNPKSVIENQEFIEI